MINVVLVRAVRYSSTFEAFNNGRRYSRLKLLYIRYGIHRQNSIWHTVKDKNSYFYIGILQDIQILTFKNSPPNTTYRYHLFYVLSIRQANSSFFAVCY